MGGELLAPRTAGACPGLLIYFHGGGYVIGSPRSHRGLAARLALGVGVPALVINYRRAPEHPFPAAFEDALTVCQFAHDVGIPCSRIVLAGDSAGGALALAVAMALRDRGRDRYAAVAMISPWLDLTPEASWRSVGRARDPAITRVRLAWMADQYARGDPGDPRISPLHGSFTDLPRLIVHTGDEDPTAADAVVLEQKAAAAGTAIEHRHYPGLWHDFHALAGVLPAATVAITDLAGSIREALLLAC